VTGVLPQTVGEFTVRTSVVGFQQQDTHNTDDRARRATGQETPDRTRGPTASTCIDPAGRHSYDGRRALASLWWRLRSMKAEVLQ
jgi:hypothetical protein